MTIKVLRSEVVQNLQAVAAAVQVAVQVAVVQAVQAMRAI